MFVCCSSGPVACEERSKRVLAVVNSLDNIRCVKAGSSWPETVNEKMEILLLSVKHRLAESGRGLVSVTALAHRVSFELSEKTINN